MSRGKDRDVDAVFVGASVSGTCTGANKPRFERCTIGTVTLPPCIMLVCGLSTAVTVGSAGDFFLLDCKSLVAGLGTPVFDFGSGVGDTNVKLGPYGGGIEIKNMGGTGTDKMTLEGWGQLIINANCSDGLIVVRGNFTKDDNANGAVEVSEDARVAVGTKMGLVTDAVDAAAIKTDAGAELAAALLDLANGIETGVTFRQAQRLQLSAAAGKLSGAGTAEVKIRNVGDTKDRIIADVDEHGNRTGVTLDVT